MYDSICAKAKSPDKTVYFPPYEGVCAGHREEDSHSCSQEGPHSGAALSPTKGSGLSVPQAPVHVLWA